MTAKDAALRGQKNEGTLEYAKNNNLLPVIRDRKPADLDDLTGDKYVLTSNAMIAKTADAKKREKYPNTIKECC